MSRQNEWPRVCIKDVCESITDCVNKTAPVVDSQTPYKMIRTTNVKNGWIDVSEVKYVEEGVFKKWTRRGAPRLGDVILTREAPLGEVGLLRSNDTVFLGQRLVQYRADADKLDNRFLLYSLQASDLQAQIKSFGSGATVEHMRVPDAERLMFAMPPLPTQRKIAAILSAYDDLIENNARRIAILEEMAQALYREWFVHFRFPGHGDVPMVESALGLVPEGWEVKSLSQLAIINAHSVIQGNKPHLIHYIDIASVTRGSIDSITTMEFNNAPGRARRFVKHGDIIWSTVRPNRRSYSLVLNPLPDTIVSTGFAVITSTRASYTYLYSALTTDEFVGYLTNRAKGSAYPAVSGEDFEGARLLAPTTSLLDKFDSIVSDVYQQRYDFAVKNDNLRRTRDLLLPKLISGELDVEELDIDTVEASV